MTDKQIIIDDQKKTIYRLQDECTEKTKAIIALGKQLKRKEQELKLAENHIKDLDLMVHNGEERENELEQKLKAKEQECERLKWYLKEIRDDELKTLDIELDEYETHCVDTEYSNIINLVEEALEEISPEDCRYKKDK